MQLQPGTSLQNGKYEILRVLGQGGFGITYEAEQVLLHKKVAIKEFFMKDCCERDAATSQVSVGTGTQRDLVTKFCGKFIREAQMIAGMDHPHIVRVTDVFEDNGTAYYVMENLPGGSLADRIRKDGPLSEAQAETYIRQVADALAYIHSLNMVHLDVKPSNILLNAKSEAVLIDFGISKHYDDSGEQTSSTPVGISKGFAPLEQNREGDVSQFKPSTDIYALGATLYNLVTGSVPPEASIVNEDGLDRPEGISDRTWNAIEKAMSPRQKDRPQNVAGFLALLGGQADGAQEESEETKIAGKEEQKVEEKPKAKPQPTPKPVPKKEPAPAPKPAPSGDGSKTKSLLWVLLGGLVVVGILLGIIFGGKKKHPDNPVVQTDSTEVVAPVQPEAQPEQAAPGSVKVSSTPAGATIWLDGKNTKKITPDILEDLTPGVHTIKLVLEDYNDYSGSVTITSGKRSDLSKTLAVKEKPSQQTQTQTQASSQTNQNTQTTSAGTTENATNGSSNGHDWVDLGLSVKWATTNVGASSPSDYGRYYAWGETSTKNEYTWTTLKYCDDDKGNDFSKYNTSSERGTVDNKTRLDWSDDVARANWGGSWRMPTNEEFEELIAKCSWTWTSKDGKNGYKVTGKNGNSIFFPANGWRDGTSVYLSEFSGPCGDYWSSSLNTDYPYEARGLYFDSSNVGTDLFYRFTGLAARPVTE